MHDRSVSSYILQINKTVPYLQVSDLTEKYSLYKQPCHVLCHVSSHALFHVSSHVIISKLSVTCPNVLFHMFCVVCLSLFFMHVGSYENFCIRLVLYYICPHGRYIAKCCTLYAACFIYHWYHFNIINWSKSWLYTNLLPTSDNSAWKSKFITHFCRIP